MIILIVGIQVTRICGSMSITAAIQVTLHMSRSRAVTATAVVEKAKMSVKVAATVVAVAVAATVMEEATLTLLTAPTAITTGPPLQTPLE